MSYLKINQEKITAENAEELIKICPFSAITYENGKLDIGAGCKMCRMCVNKGPRGAVEFIREEAPSVDKSQWKGVAVFVEHDEGKIHPVTLELIGKARELAKVTGQPVYALFIGSDIAEPAKKLLFYGVDEVFAYDYPALKHFLILPYANVFTDFINRVKPSSVLVGATHLGRSLAPRVAARFRTGLTADCTFLDMKENTDLVQIRPAFGGNIMAQIITPRSRPQFCTVRYKIFSAPQKMDTPRGRVTNMEIAPEQLAGSMQVLDIIRRPKDIDISEAEVIVAVGRGVKARADLSLAEELASLLGAQMACTRPLIEAGWFDAKHQIGLSGRTVKAKLIITLGISGSVQFAAGMRNSDCIVAVNRDKNASVFDVAHYGFVGDLYEIVPLLIQQIKEAK